MINNIIRTMLSYYTTLYNIRLWWINTLCQDVEYLLTRKCTVLFHRLSALYKRIHTCSDVIELDYVLTVSSNRILKICQHKQTLWDCPHTIFIGYYTFYCTIREYIWTSTQLGKSYWASPIWLFKLCTSPNISRIVQ